MRYHRTSLLALLLLLFSGMVLAQGAEDFSATSSQSYNLCPCSGQGYPVTIINTGSVESTYTVAPQSSLEPWIRVEPSSFTLPPGRGTRVSVFVTTACHAQGRLPVTLFISTQSGLTKSLQQELRIDSCYNHTLTPGEPVGAVGNQSALTVEPQEGPYRVCAAVRTTIPVLARNDDAAFDNTYQFSVSGVPWASAAVQEYDLAAGSSGVVLVQLSPTRQEIGQHALSLRSVSQKGDIAVERQIQVDVEECYASSVNIFPERENLCGGFTAAYPVEITNTGARQDRISLSASGADWARVNWTYVDLPPGGSTTTRLVVTPPGGMDGRATLTVRSTGSETFSVSGQDSMELSVVPFLTCYSIGIDSQRKVENAYEQQYVPIILTNNGEFPDDYSLSLEGPEWMSLEDGNVSLNPGQSHHFVLVLDPGEEVEEGTYQATISVEGIHHIQQRTVSVDVERPGGFGTWLWGQFVLYRYYLLALLVLAVLILMFFRPLSNYFAEMRKERRLHRMRKIALEQAREKRQAAQKEKPQKEIRPKRKKPSSIHDTITWAAIAITVVLSLAFSIFPTHMRTIFGPYFGYVLVGAAVGVVIIVVGYVIYKSWKFFSGRLFG